MLLKLKGAALPTEGSFFVKIRLLPYIKGGSFKKSILTRFLRVNLEFSLVGAIYAEGALPTKGKS